jgi:hypothetical protein
MHVLMRDCSCMSNSIACDEARLERIKAVVQEFRNKWEEVRRPSCPAGPGRPRRPKTEYGTDSDTWTSSAAACAGTFSEQRSSICKSRNSSSHTRAAKGAKKGANNSKRTNSDTSGDEESTHSTGSQSQGQRQRQRQRAMCGNSPDDADEAPAKRMCTSDVGAPHGHGGGTGGAATVAHTGCILVAGNGSLTAAGMHGSLCSLIPPPLLTSPPSPLHWREEWQGSAGRVCSGGGGGGAGGPALHQLHELQLEPLSSSPYATVQQLIAAQNLAALKTYGISKVAAHSSKVVPPVLQLEQPRHLVCAAAHAAAAAWPPGCNPSASAAAATRGGVWVHQLQLEPLALAETRLPGSSSGGLWLLPQHGEAPGGSSASCAGTSVFALGDFGGGVSRSGGQGGAGTSDKSWHLSVASLNMGEAGGGLQRGECRALGGRGEQVEGGVLSSASRLTLPPLRHMMISLNEEGQT